VETQERSPAEAVINRVKNQIKNAFAYRLFRQ